MKKDQKFNFFIFMLGVIGLVAGMVRLFQAWGEFRCDVWGIGPQCIVPQTYLGSHILLDVLSILASLIIGGIGIAVIVHTLRPLFKNKFAPQAIPQFPGKNIQIFYLSNPVTKTGLKIGFALLLLVALFFLCFILWLISEPVICYFMSSNSCANVTYGIRHIAFLGVFILISLVQVAGLQQLYCKLKSPLFWLSEEGIQLEHTFVKWTDAKRLVCSKTFGTYLQLRQTGTFSEQDSVDLHNYPMLSLADRETFKQAVRAYIPVEEIN